MSRRILVLSTLAFVVFVSSAVVVGVVQARQSNDDIEFAAHVNKIPYSIEGIDTTYATKELGEPPAPCLIARERDVSKSIWYRVRIKKAATYEFNTIGSTYDTVVSVYRAPSNEADFSSLLSVACNDDSWPTRPPTGLQTLLEVDLAPGTYFVQIGDYQAANFTQQHTTNFAVLLAPDQTVWPVTCPDGTMSQANGGTCVGHGF